MEQVSMKAEIRDKVGSRASEKLRKAGKVPAVVYGHKQDTVAVCLDADQFENALKHGTHLLSLDISGKAETVLINEVQYDYLGMHALHADLTRVNISERVTVSVPVELRGTPAGAEEGGVLMQTTNEIEIECVVTEIPDSIRHSVADMQVGESIQAGQLVLPGSITLVTSEDTTIASLQVIEEAAEEEEGAEPGAAEPELIGRDEDEDGEGDEE